MGTKRITCKFCGEYMKSYDLYVSHIESSHSEFIPQDMTAWRFVYYLKTGKTHGSCIICKNDTEWNEKTHKYHRFCNNPKCKEKYVETFQNRMIGKYGKVNLLNDPEQQKKMLANRKISGVYTWRDHVHETPYTGTYELSFLKFLDEIMEFNPEDVIGPSPHTYYYIYEGQKHFYIPDFFIPSLNLEIEIKEGTNNHPKIQAVDKVKERLKDEVMKSNSNSFNYIKIIEKNNFRFIEFLDEAKKRFLNGDKRPIVMCESVEDNLFDELITENKIINDKDIYYNKDKFDSGEINLCFITGHSGSGKSTMGRDMESDKIEHYDLDDVIYNWNFSDSNLKEYGDLIYSFFRGFGKKYRYISRKDWDNDPTWDNKNEYKDAYEISIIKDFIKYTKYYVNSHKNIKFVIEGVWIFHFIEPKEIDNYAVYIKGTSQTISSIRAAKRDSEGDNKFKKSIDFTKQITSPGRTKKYIHDEQKVVKFRNYFKDKIKKQKIITETVEDNLFDELITENKIINDKDIYYNKDKFDSGEINLCFITGLSGSGKTTMGKTMQSGNIEVYELDDIISNWNFSDANLKEYGSLVYSFFKGPGKMYRYTSYDEWMNDSKWDNPTNPYANSYDAMIIKDFIKYAKLYANSHKNIKFVLEGVWVFYFIDPKELDNFAVYIKGTSVLISFIRSAKRDCQDANSNMEKFGSFIKMVTSIGRIKGYLSNEKRLLRFYEYFASKVINESQVFLENTNISDIRNVINKIYQKYLKDKKPPTGNQNCQLCTWCVESWFRGINVLPRPVYSPTDIAFKFNGYDIVKNPELIKFRSKEDFKRVIHSSGNGSRYYIHVKWNGGSGGHEFMAIGIDNIIYIIDSQQGIIENMDTSYVVKDYFNINYDESYMVRLDNKQFNKELLKYNNSKYIKQLTEDDMKMLEENAINESLEDVSGIIFGKRKLFQDELITENIGDKYIRITYNGNGIYQEFKENVSFNVWKEFKNSNATKWLPIPPAYEGNYKSYFTIKGYKMFMKETYPFIIKYLDKNKIKVEEIHFNDSPNVVYKDEFQIVVDGNSDIITESNKSHLYHISNRQNIKTINPSIPNNFMTKNNYEENKTKRVCFAPSIEQCLMGLSRNCEGEEFYVYIPIKDYKTYSPNIKDVPDSGITGEIWIKEPVDVLCIGKIKVLDTNKTPGKLYTYGNGQTAELYAFDYKWIEKYK